MMTTKGPQEIWLDVTLDSDGVSVMSAYAKAPIGYTCTAVIFFPRKDTNTSSGRCPSLTLQL